MRPVPAHRHSLSTRLAAAPGSRPLIDLALVRVHYQPQVCLRTLQVIAVEALVRYEDPEFGRLQPRDVLQLAEESRVLPALTERVVEIALEDLAAWGVPDTVRLGINLSAAQLADATLPSRLDRLRRRFAVAADRFEIEVAETTLTRVSGATRLVSALKAAGPRICLDDFCAGRGALQIVQRLPFDLVKVSKDCVEPIGESPDGDVTVRAILEMGRMLGVPIAADGVDTTDQFEFLVANGGARAQGYLISRPLDGAAFGRFLLRYGQA